MEKKGFNFVSIRFGMIRLADSWNSYNSISTYMKAFQAVRRAVEYNSIFGFLPVCSNSGILNVPLWN